MTNTKLSFSVMCLLAGSTSASTPSPTKRRYGATTGFPGFNNASALATDAATGGSNAKVDANTVYKVEIVQNADGQVGGLYHLFRLRDTAVAIPQTLDPGVTSAGSDVEATAVKNITVVNSAAAGEKAFYLTDATKTYTWNASNAAPTSGTDSGNINDTKFRYTGKQQGGCAAAKLVAVADAAALVQCGAILTYLQEAVGTKVTKWSYVKQRMVMSSQYASDQALGTVGSLPAGTNAEPNADLKLAGWNADVILGSFYQSNGVATDGSKWCQNGSSGTDAEKLAYSQKLPTTGDVTLTATRGIGPRSKCSWQVLAADTTKNRSAPVFTLETATNTNFLLQAIEWVDYTAMGTAAIIDATKASTSTSPIANNGAVDYLATDAVYLNPLTAGDAAVVTSLPAATYTMHNNQDDASQNEEGSLGSAVYYDRSTGVAKDFIRAVDSQWLLPAKGLAGWQGACDLYDSAVAAYETAKTTYEGDNTKTKPEHPWTLTYSGWTLELDPTKTTADWGTTLKAATTQKTAYLGNKSTAVDYNASSLTYADDQIKEFNSRVSYLVNVVDKGTTTITDGATTQAVSHAFGKLGQGAASGVTSGAPFIWQKEGTDDTLRPGMNISVFPEVGYTDTSVGVPSWDAWGNSASVTIKTKLVVSEALTAFAVPAPTKTPSALPTATTGAQALAASVMAAAAVASTLF